MDLSREDLSALLLTYRPRNDPLEVILYQVRDERGRTECHISHCDLFASCMVKEAGSITVEDSRDEYVPTRRLVLRRWGVIHFFYLSRVHLSVGVLAMRGGWFGDYQLSMSGKRTISWFE